MRIEWITAFRTSLGKKSVLEIQELQKFLMVQLLIIEDEFEERMKHEDERQGTTE